MKLKKIKLAGFKSFVDPTTLSLPSNLVAVVGPNGCGKSNIIDAVCWVMGESSAKYLRGESLTDVIFNGSSARKPVGQASVELLFDNQEGKLKGEYGSYAEISIKRLINRDSESTYYLNGSRCRRRDIVDIFLGTGLGPRSYSIIGQNMISRIIDAKPDEMRVYLEEAAGVSKYKDRRRETENRINHTKENLTRLDDVRSELEKQLNHLKRQANAAEKFKTLKQEERLQRAQWQSALLRNIDTQIAEKNLVIKQSETELESYNAKLSTINLSIESERDAQQSANEEYQEVQRVVYQIGNEIGRAEQDIAHIKQRKMQWEKDLSEVNNDWEHAHQELEEANEELTECEREINELEPSWEQKSALVTSAQNYLTQTEFNSQEWQSKWDSFNQLQAKTTQTAEVEKTRIQNFENKISSINLRQTKIAEELQKFDFSEIESEINTFSEKLKLATETSMVKDEELKQIKDNIQVLKDRQQKTTTSLDKIKSDLQKTFGLKTSLEVLQQTALGQRNNKMVQWLAKHQLDKKKRLAQNIEVEAGWEPIVEYILGNHLQAVCVDNLNEIVPLISDFKEGCFSAFASLLTHNDVHKSETLLSKVKSKKPLDTLLSGIYTAETQEEAFKIAANLNPHESVVTKDGLWLGGSWLEIIREIKPESGVFQREQELKKIIEKLQQLEREEKNLKDQLDTIQTELKNSEITRENLQKEYHVILGQISEINASIKIKTERLKELKLRQINLENEKNENFNQLKQTEIDFANSRAIWQEALTQLEKFAVEKENYIQEREAIREKLQAARMDFSQSKEELHKIEIRLQTNKSQRGNLKQNIARIESQLKILEERKDNLENNSEDNFSLSELEEKLKQKLNDRLRVETELKVAREKVEAHAQSLRDNEVTRHEIENQINQVRNILESLRIEGQSLKVKSENIIEQIKELGFTPENIISELSENISAEELHAQLDQTIQRIARLGAINLVAIEEYSTCLERKEYLDKQYEDLQAGLATLEEAIAKIDKETRARFKETFEKVNEHFQDLFPKVFGGGKAYLELLSDNLLEAGISIMACPPGKRNSTIHLLSGGEKAMTAIALVFSIFQLNPAPFCLLDEVDAPLDDANIGRYCQLVQAMSDKTQFIFISHNKLAIEMGHHLIGVTMHEPGVSRLVSVNVEEAVKLAEEVV